MPAGQVARCGAGEVGKHGEEDDLDDEEDDRELVLGEHGPHVDGHGTLLLVVV